jgi:hypothetical protein
MTIAVLSKIELHALKFDKLETEGGKLYSNVARRDARLH